MRKRGRILNANGSAVVISINRILRTVWLNANTADIVKQALQYTQGNEAGSSSNCEEQSYFSPIDFFRYEFSDHGFIRRL